MKQALVVRDLRGERVANLARMLDARLLLVSRYAGDPAWADIERIPLIESGPIIWYPEGQAVRWSEVVAEALADFDAVWFADAPELAFGLVRRRRLSRVMRPAAIILAPWDPPHTFPHQDEITRNFMLEYARAGCDWVAPHEQWPELREPAARLAANPVKRTPRAPATSPAVTVCIPHFNHPKLLPQVLESFERQTCQDFTVLVMDDGSTLPEAKQQFAAMSEKYAARGWRFAAQANAGPSAARNHAARLAQTEFLLFFDSDDFAAPTLVERMLDGILLTGVDLVVADAWVFEGQNPPVDAAGKPTARPAKRFAWLGQSQLASVMDDQHGGPVIIVRRERFLELGGYREHAVKAAEDYEFNVRATLRGATLDVIPEPLQWYRDSPGSVSKVTPLFHNHESVLRNFRAIFAPHGLHGLEGLLRGLFLEERAARRAVADAPSFPTILKRSRRLRILITAPYPLHPELGGGSLRSCNLARYLAARHQVTVACFGWATPIKIQKQFERFYSIAEGDPREFSWRLPRRTASLHTRAMGTALRILGAQRWDVCLVDQIHMAIYREALEGFRVLSEHNVESSLLARIAALSPEDGQAHHDARLMRELEDHLWPEFPLRCGVSQSDCDEMDRRARRGRSILAPNGCDPDSAIRGLKPDTRTLCFPGSLDYAPNIDAAHYLVEQIWPLVRSRLPQARLLIAGARPVPSIARLQGPDIEVIANPPRMEPVAARTSVLVAPLRAGGGTRIKILNAFAWGLPVVSTALGAEGLEVKDGEHLLLRDDPEEFAKAAVDLLTNESLWRRLQANGRNLARARYSWDQAFTALETEIRRECGLP